MVYVQAPRTQDALFDLIITPRHDQLSQPNTFNITGSPNRVTAELLAAASNEFADTLAHLPGPRAAVLIGGDSKRHHFTPETCTGIIETVERVRAQAASVMITLSRRTPDKLTTALQERYGWEDRVWLYTGDGPNPYFALLGSADWILVTEDSTNMLCEAAATGRPVYRLAVDGSAGKFARLYAQLQGMGAVRPFLGALEHWDYEPLHETERAADKVLEILNA